jgi:tetratricopeptide (TPR) repeat protein
MAPRLRIILLSSALVLVSASLPKLEPAALAAGLDARGEADALEATTFYKQGRYDEAAKIFAKLSVQYPEMLIFERNVGACFYYLKKPEPALSNLRNYLNHKSEIEPDDKVVVDRWMDEMEKLRAEGAAAAPVAAPLAGPAVPAAAPIAADAVSASAVSPAAPAPALAGAVLPAEATQQPVGVDLAAYSPGKSDPIAHPYYKTWWFWTGAVAVVAGGAVAAVLGHKTDSNVPGSPLGNHGVFQ